MRIRQILEDFDEYEDLPSEDKIVDHKVSVDADIIIRKDTKIENHYNAIANWVVYTFGREVADIEFEPYRMYVSDHRRNDSQNDEYTIGEYIKTWESNHNDRLSREPPPELLRKIPHTYRVYDATIWVIISDHDIPDDALDHRRAEFFDEWHKMGEPQELNCEVPAWLVTQ